MFAVIFLISIISLLLMSGVTALQKISMPWTRNENNLQKHVRRINMKNKLIILFCILALIATMTACGKKMRQNNYCS